MSTITEDKIRLLHVQAREAYLNERNAAIGSLERGDISCAETHLRKLREFETKLDVYIDLFALIKEK